ncbi:MAG TPA: hypothetical protein VHV81_14855 [Steroidobacteraceae bacterium]|jgi:hypothetical protein|nr:hypothetical protein [Steroidobacteraceae bacterium]
MNSFANPRRWREFVTAAQAATQSLTTCAVSYPSVLEAPRRSREWFSEAAEGVRIRCSTLPVETPPA